MDEGGVNVLLDSVILIDHRLRTAVLPTFSLPGIPHVLAIRNTPVRRGGISGIHTAGGESARDEPGRCALNSAIALRMNLLRSMAAWIPDPLVQIKAASAT